LCAEPELSPSVHFKKHTSSTKNIPIVFFKKKLNKPLPGFPPSFRLKKPQTKPTSLIPPEQLQEISWQDFWRSHAPRGANKKSCQGFLFTGISMVPFAVCRLCSGKMARWTLPHEKPCYKLFYSTRQQLTLLRSLLYSDT
jgi:hypothetical protein